MLSPTFPLLNVIDRLTGNENQFGATRKMVNFYELILFIVHESHFDSIKIQSFTIVSHDARGNWS